MIKVTGVFEKAGFAGKVSVLRILSIQAFKDEGMDQLYIGVAMTDK